MRKQIAVLLLCCYALVLVKPVFPVFHDLLAHVLWKAEHMATVHYENGKYHLHAELQEAEPKGEKPSAPAAVADESITAHLPVAKAVHFGPAETFRRSAGIKDRIPLNVHLSIPSPPPWLFC